MVCLYLVLVHLPINIKKKKLLLLKMLRNTKSCNVRYLLKTKIRNYYHYGYSVTYCEIQDFT